MRSLMSALLLDYLPLVVFIAVALGIGLALLIAPFIVAYKQPDPEKLSAYEVVLVTAGRKSVEVRVSPAGKILEDGEAEK